jgi:hypothetical protein
MKEELTEEKHFKLSDIYYKQGAKFGVQKLFKLVQQEYPQLRITRNNVNEWLKKQEEHQKNQPVKRIRHTKSIKSNNKHELLQIDLIDYSQNASPNQNKYIVMIIDVYSRYLWAYATKSKNSNKIAETFEKFLNEIDTSKYPIKKIQTDKGGEFMGEFDELLKKHDILHIANSNPQANGIIERTNYNIKSLIAKYLQNKPNLNQFTVLDKIVDIYNNSYHRSIKMNPIQAYNIDTEKERKDLNKIHNDRIRKKEEKDKQGDTLVINRNDKLEKEDMVRISKIQDKKLKKDYINRWSEDYYQISRIIKSKKEGVPIKYKIRDPYTNGKESEYSKKYYREELQKVYIAPK